MHPTLLPSSPVSGVVCVDVVWSVQVPDAGFGGGGGGDDGALAVAGSGRGGPPRMHAARAHERNEEYMREFDVG